MRRVRRYALVVFMTAILVVPLLQSLGASEEEPPCLRGRPARDRQVTYAIFDDSLGEWRVSELHAADDGTRVDRFGEQYIWICYGVKPASERSGALSVKVSRYFENVDSVYFTKTILYRGPGFVDAVGRPLPSSERIVSRREYSDFHKEHRIHPILQRNFHAYWDRGEQFSTLAPDWRRRLFLFPTEGEERANQTSYLLRYETSNLGSWIPFSIGTGGRDADQLQKVYVIIADLGANRMDAEIERVLVRGR